MAFKLICILFCFSLVAFGKVNGQTVNVQFGEKFKSERTIQILGKTDKTIWVITNQKKKAAFNVYDAESLTLLKEVEISYHKGKEISTDFVRAIFLEGKTVYLFVEGTDKLTSTHKLFVKKIDGDSFNESDWMEVLSAEVTTKIKSTFFHVGLDSINNNFKILYVHPYKKNSERKIGFAQVSLELEKVSEKDYMVPASKAYFNSIQFASDSTNRMYALFDFIEVEFGKGQFPRGFLLFSYSPENGTLKDYTFDKPKTVLFSSRLIISGNEALVVGQYKNEEITEAGITGLFFMRINPNESGIKLQKFNEFSVEFRKRNRGGYKYKETHGLNLGHKIFGSYVASDGSLFVFSQEQFMETYNPPGSQGASASVDLYNYLNITIFKFDQDGKIEWDKTIYRGAQDVSEGKFASSMVNVVNDTLCLIWLDDPSAYDENGSRVKNPTAKRFDNSVVTALYFPLVDGEYYYQRLFNSTDNQTYLCPGKSHRFYSDQILILGSVDRNHYRLGILKLVQ